MKVIFVEDCVNCPFVRHGEWDTSIIYCNHDSIGCKNYTAPDTGIHPDCPLEALGVIKEYTRGGCTQTNI